MGRTSLVAWQGDESAQGYVAALERHSSHPIAQALSVCIDEDVEAYEVAAVEQQLGAGMAGTVDGRWIVVGTAAYLQSQDVFVSEEFEDVRSEVARAGTPHVMVGVDGCCVALAVFDDPLREDASASVADLQRAGWHVSILSGDHSDVVAHVGERLGISAVDVRGEATPEDKVAYVEAAAEEGRAVMVGDGVNDAAALSAATVGIAVHGGAEASLAAADVYLNRPGLSAIVELLGASRTTLRTIRRSLAISLAYNTIAASLAMAGLIGPLVAAILMPISSFTVLALAFFSPTFGDGP